MITAPHSNGAHANGAAPPTTPVIATWAGVVRRRWQWALGVSALVMGAVVALILFSRPIYRADARVRLADPPPMTGVNPTAGMLSMFGVGGSAFANDFQVLRSRSLREHVVAER